jgi:3-methyladenine DNA glycosylase AlkC
LLQPFLSQTQEITDMSERPIKHRQPKAVPGTTQVPSISQVMGLVPTLPGESEAQYQQSLAALIQELEAKTVLQVYLAEKIHDCLWWIRRYEQQKRMTIIAEMGAIIKGSFSNNVSAEQEYVRDMLAQNKTSQTLKDLLARARHTPESLRQLATERKAAWIAKLDMQIALQTKILAGLQSSYEVAFNRKSHAERLNLQNDLLRRDLQAIDVTAQEVQNDGQRQTNRRQSP